MDDHAIESSNRNGIPPWLKSVLMILMPIALLLIIAIVFGPAERERSRINARQTQCKNNLRMFGIALRNYHVEYGTFPPAYTVDENGNRLHSWRTLLLPFMDQNPLYTQVDLSKPWDDPANDEVRELAINIFAYRCPSTDIPETHTTYQVVISPDGLFHNDKPRTLADITDGAANTLMVIEVPEDQAVHWMSPYDASEQTIWNLNDMNQLSHKEGVQAVMADGSVRFIETWTSIEERQAMITIAAGDNEREEKEAEQK